MSRLDEIKARADAATPGPWLLDGPWWTDDGGPEPTALPCVVDASRALVVFPPDATDVGMKRPEDRAANMAFIAAAREDVPWLLALVESLTAERDALAAQVARVEALGEEWLAMDEANADYFSRERLDPTLAVRVATVRQEQLQAVLAGSEADTSNTQPTDQEVK